MSSGSLARFTLDGQMRRGPTVESIVEQALNECNKQIRKLEDDMCDFMLLNGQSDKRDMSVEEYLESENKL